MAPAAAPVDALLFDLGGVLLGIDFKRAFEAWARAAQVPIGEIEARFSFDAAYEAHERGEIAGVAYFAHVRRQLGVSLTEDELLAGWNAIFLGPPAGIERLLAQLAKTCPLYVLSNTNPAHRDFWQSRYRALLAPISAIFCSCDLGERKPSGSAFLEVCRRVGIAPSRIAFFDDLAANVLGARAAGLLGFHVSSVDGIRETLARELRIAFA